MSKKRGLGKGLGALIPPTSAKPDGSDEVKAGAIELDVDDIVPNPHQPRQVWDQEKLQELADSIIEHGLIQPLVVTQSGGKYQIIAGERRWRASRLAGLTSVPVIIKETTPQQMLELAIVENIQRADLNPLEEAEAYAQLMENFGLTQEAVATKIGKSRTAVANTVRLLNLPEIAKKALAEGDITEGHARPLLSKELKKSDQLRIFQTIIARELTVRQTEALVKQVLDPEPSKPKRPPLTPNDKSMMVRFESKLGTKVELNRTDEDAGRITIHFYSQEELQAIFNAILGEDEHL